jgi:hypothetical protein
MQKMNFAAAAVTGLAFAALPIAVIEAAPLAGAFAPAVESNVTSIAHRCWYEAGGQLVCARMHYRYDPANYLTYGCPADRRRHHRRYERDDSDIPLSEWPYYFHDYCRPDGHPHPIGMYGGKAFYFGGVW